LDSFDVSKRTFLQTLHEALDSRFSYADHGLVKATQIVDFKCWPDSSEKSEVEGITLGLKKNNKGYSSKSCMGLVNTCM
jgi:hypothetical protein